MKKLIALASVIVAMFVFAPTNAEAGYKSKRIGSCQHCNGNIYSYYKPIRYSNGYTRWSWVPAYHHKCAASARARSVHSHYSRSYRPALRPSFRSRHFNRGPSFSIRFGSGGFCR